MTHLTSQTLDHRLSFNLRVICPPTPTKVSRKVVTILVLCILLLYRGVQGTRVCEDTRWAVAPEFALGKKLELLMVGVACN